MNEVLHDAIWQVLFFIIIFNFFLQLWKKIKLHDPGIDCAEHHDIQTIKWMFSASKPCLFACVFYLKEYFDSITT